MGLFTGCRGGEGRWKGGREGVSGSEKVAVVVEMVVMIMVVVVVGIRWILWVWKMIVISAQCLFIVCCLLYADAGI